MDKRNIVTIESTTKDLLKSQGGNISDQQVYEAIKCFNSIKDEFFSDDYHNDNVLDLLNGCWWVLLKILVLDEFIRRGSITSVDETRRMKEEIFDLGDTLFLRLRLLFSRNERFSGGKFLERLKNLPNIYDLIVSLHCVDTCNIYIVKTSDYKRSMIQVDGKEIIPQSDIRGISTDFPCYILSKKHIQDFKDYIIEFYKNLYCYDCSERKNPETINKYQRERFHQNNHLDGKKYSLKNMSAFTKVRIAKPGVNLKWICESLNGLSGVVLMFANACEFNTREIIKYRRLSYDLRKEIISVVQMYGIDNCNEIVDLVEARAKKDLPKLLEVIKLSAL